jgi:hypothetical protein
MTVLRLKNERPQVTNSPPSNNTVRLVTTEYGQGSAELYASVHGWKRCLQAAFFFENLTVFQISWNEKVHYHAHKSSLLDRTLHH